MGLRHVAGTTALHGHHQVAAVRGALRGRGQLLHRPHAVPVGVDEAEGVLRAALRHLVGDDLAVLVLVEPPEQECGVRHLFVRELQGTREGGLPEGAPLGLPGRPGRVVQRVLVRRGRRAREAARTGDRPQDLARAEVVGRQLVRAPHDQLVAVGVRPQERRAVGLLELEAVHAPQFLSIGHVEHEHGRLRRSVARDDQQALVQQRGRAHAEAVAGVRETLLPLLLPLQVVRDEAVVAEVEDHALAVGDRSRERRQLRVGVEERHPRLSLEALLPERLAGLLVEAQRDVPPLGEAGEEDATSRDHGRGVAGDDVRLPEHVPVRRQRRRQDLARGAREASGAAKLRPVGALGDGRDGEEGRGEREATNHARGSELGLRRA